MMKLLQFKPTSHHCILLLWLTLLLSRTSTIQAQTYEERSSTFDAMFKFEPVRGDGNLSDAEIENWSLASGEFFAAMFDQLNDENTTTPMLAPGVIISLRNQDRYVASTGNFGQVNYGVSLEVNFVVTYQTDPTAPTISAANQVLRIFDRDDKGNLVFFSPYLSALRFSVGSAAFSSVNKMSINVNGPRDIDLESPIPTLPLPPPTDAPTVPQVTQPPTKEPTKAPTKAPTLAPSETPSKAPSPNPTPTGTLEPTIATDMPTAATASPTMAPVTANPTAPDETFAPTPVPDPTDSPTVNPTAAPTLPLESFFATSKLSFVDAATTMDINATFYFQQVTSSYLSTIIQDLLRDTMVEEVTVQLETQTLVEPETKTASGGGLRKLQGANSANEPSRLLVEFNTVLKIRSTTSVNAPSLVQSAFGTAGRRENYRRLLLASQDPILNSVTLVELEGSSNSIDRSKDAEPPAESGGLGTAALVGIGVGCCLFAIAILGIWYKANNSNNGKSDDADSQKGQIPTAQMSASENGRLQGRLDAEIVVNKNDDDVSTLGDPFFGMSLDERTCADKTATSASVQQSYDFLKLMGKGGNAMLGTTTEGQEDDEETTASKIRRNTLNVDDDASFEDMFGEMK